MDESLKVTIATISGFVIAFFAEPVKMYFQQRSKRKTIRRALYFELYYNYDHLTYFFDKRKDRAITRTDMFQFVEGVKHIARLEVYQYCITQNVDLFYQFKEAITINSLYANLNRLLEIAPLRVEKNIPFDQTMTSIRHFLGHFVDSVQTGKLDKRLLTEITGREKVNALLQKKY